MGPQAPVYVAGFERGVRPMGDWSMRMALSIYSMPKRDLHAPGVAFDPYNRFAIPLYMVSYARDDLPDPETPVTQMNRRSGNSTVIFLRLFSVAPVILIES